jgi:hypothetical protein
VGVFWLIFVDSKLAYSFNQGMKFKLYELSGRRARRGRWQKNAGRSAARTYHDPK